MADELIDVIDQNNQVVGQEMKSKVHEKGLRHRVCAILLKNKEGEYLIPTASEIKVEAGGLYHSAAGHVASGETALESAKRELMEEDGLKANDEDFQLIGSYWAEKDYPTRKEKEWFSVFEIEYDALMGEVKMNEEQVDEQWLSKEELRNIYKNNFEKLSYNLGLSCKYLFKFDR